MRRRRVLQQWSAASNEYARSRAYHPASLARFSIAFSELVCALAESRAPPEANKAPGANRYYFQMRLAPPNMRTRSIR